MNNTTTNNNRFYAIRNGLFGTHGVIKFRTAEDRDEYIRWSVSRGYDLEACDEPTARATAEAMGAGHWERNRLLNGKALPCMYWSTI